jgi:acylphosphatase
MSASVTPTGGTPVTGASVLHVIVRGRVQGVGFRWFVRTEARRLGLAGWVRNLPDGTVELRAAGIESFLASLRTAIGRGPDNAHVTDIEAVAADTPGLKTDTPYPFTILR